MSSNGEPASGFRRRGSWIIIGEGEGTTVEGNLHVPASPAQPGARRMKPAYAAALAFVAVLASAYLCGAFIAMDFNPAAWASEGRAAGVNAAIPLALLAAFFSAAMAGRR